MDHNSPTEDDPKQLEEAQIFWNAFTHGTKISIIAIIVVVIGLAIAFVPTGS